MERRQLRAFHFGLWTVLDPRMGGLEHHAKGEETERQMHGRDTAEGVTSRTSVRLGAGRDTPEGYGDRIAGAFRKGRWLL
jgi:hypothetical protein